MKSLQPAFGVGVFLLLGLAAVAYLTIKLGAGQLFGKETYLLQARFSNVGGLNVGSMVLLGGVQIGRVEALRIEPSDYSAIVTLRLLSSIPLPADTIASIRTNGLIGDKFVALSPGADDQTLQPGDLITDTESAVDLESLISRIAFGGVHSSESPAPSVPPETGLTPAPPASPSSLTPAQEFHPDSPTDIPDPLTAP